MVISCVWWSAGPCRLRRSRWLRDARLGGVLSGAMLRAGRNRAIAASASACCRFVTPAHHSRRTRGRSCCRWRERPCAGRPAGCRRQACGQVAAQQRDQRRRLDGLPQQRRAPRAARSSPATEVLAVAGVEDHRQPGRSASSSLRELEAGHPRHRLVGDHEVEALGIVGERIARGLGHRTSAVTSRPQPPAARAMKLADHLLVVDHQHAAGQPRRLRARGAWPRSVACPDPRAPRPQRRQEHAERRAARRALSPPTTCPPCSCTMPCTIASPMPLPLPDFLGGEERLEHALQHLGRDARAGVAHGELDEVAAGSRLRQRRAHRPACVRRPHADAGSAAVAAHRVARIDAQVEQHLLDLHRVEPAPRGTSVVELGVAARASTRQRRAQQLAAPRAPAAPGDRARARRAGRG